MGLRSLEIDGVQVVHLVTVRGRVWGRVRVQVKVQVRVGIRVKVRIWVAEGRVGPLKVGLGVHRPTAARARPAVALPSRADARYVATWLVFKVRIRVRARARARVRVP